MSKTILVFGASNSKQSINNLFAKWASKQMVGFSVNFLNLNDFEMPIYSIDRENENGIPDLALNFREQIRKADGILISFAEHNGAYSVAFKNIFDWVSRTGKNMWENKPMFLMATSPGTRGGTSVLSMAENRFRFMNQNVIITFSLPSFEVNFNNENGIIHQELKEQFQSQLNQFIKVVNG